MPKNEKPTLFRIAEHCLSLQPPDTEAAIILGYGLYQGLNLALNYPKWAQAALEEVIQVTETRESLSGLAFQLVTMFPSSTDCPEEPPDEGKEG